ncbi:MAG TPA: ABC transporter permease [Candidatus Angelobacter sp.]
MQTFIQDIRFALRMLRKNPGFALIAVLVLAIGIGANAAIFSVIDTVLLRPLPYPESDRLVYLEDAYKEVGHTPISYPQYQFWRDQHEIFDQVLTFVHGSAALTGLQEPEQVATIRVSANFLPTLGIKPIAGRIFLPEEEPRSGPLVVMLTESFWRKHFQANPAAIGQKLTLNDGVCTIIGVLPDSFRMGSPFDIVLPLRTTGPAGLNFLPAIGRLRPGMNITQARAALPGVLPAYREADHGLDNVVLTPYQEWLVGDSRPLLLVLFGGVVAILLISCANTANLLLARAAAREKEIAVRISLGAGNMRLARQLLTESTLLSLLGGILGILLAWASLKSLTTLLADRLPAGVPVHLDGRILLFAILLSLLTGLVFGLAPILQLVRGNLHERLKQGGRQSGAAAGSQRLRHVLVIAEIAISLVLLAGAGLLLRSMVRLMNVDKGFNSDHVMTMVVRPSPARYSDHRKEITYLQQIVERVSALPGIKAAGMVHALPITGGATNGSITVEGMQGKPNADKQYVGGDYFQTLGIPLLKGRFFNAGDTPDSPRVVIINQEFARQFFPNQDPIGKRVDNSWGDPGWSEVIGVVGDIKQADLTAEHRPSTYMLYAQNASILQYLDVNLVVRTSLEPGSTLQAIQAQVRQLDASQPVAEPRTMNEVISASLAPQRAPTWLFGVFSAIALFLAAIGIYGVLSYFVVQRSQEIGIRMALGARRSSVLSLILRQGARLIGIGVAVGVVGAFFAARALTSLLFGVKPTDLPTFLSVAILLAVLGLVACAAPALRATRVDPLVVLRNE